MQTQVVILVAGISAAVAVGGFVSTLVRPTRSLAGRINPYLQGPDSDRTRNKMPARMTVRGRGEIMLVQWFTPVVDLARKRGYFGDEESMENLQTKIRQAGKRYTSEEYLAVSVGQAIVFGTLGFLGGFLLTRSIAGMVGVGAMALLYGILKQRGELDSAIEKRSATMRLELYTVNQLLAIYLRTGSGVVQAINRLNERSTGEIIGELEETANWISGGLNATEAFKRAAEVTPEPYVARTYKLLGVASERGSDLATALMRMSEDMRETRLEEMRRQATKKKGLMLIPTLLILAPVTVLFVGAPLVSLVGTSV